MNFDENFKENSLNIVGNCGELWRKMFNFASEISKLRNTHAIFR